MRAPGWRGDVDRARDLVMCAKRGELYLMCMAGATYFSGDAHRRHIVLVLRQREPQNAPCR
jgi:hypothetical protein